MSQGRVTNPLGAGTRWRSPWCINCGQPRKRYRRCEACRRYREQYGVERPRRLLQAVSRGGDCWCGVPVYRSAPRRGLCWQHYAQDLARRKATGAPLQGWGA